MNVTHLLQIHFHRNSLQSIKMIELLKACITAFIILVESKKIDYYFPSKIYLYFKLSIISFELNAMHLSNEQGGLEERKHKIFR